MNNIIIVQKQSKRELFYEALTFITLIVSGINVILSVMTANWAAMAGWSVAFLATLKNIDS